MRSARRSSSGGSSAFGSCSGGPIAKKATTLFAEVLDWLETQFRALGKGEESQGLAVHLLSATQGVSLLAYTFHDPGLIDAEAARLMEWIRGL